MRQSLPPHLVAVDYVHDDRQLAAVRPFIEVHHPPNLNDLAECLLERRERSVARMLGGQGTEGSHSCQGHESGQGYAHYS